MACFKQQNLIMLLTSKRLDNTVNTLENPVTLPTVT